MTTESTAIRIAELLPALLDEGSLCATSMIAAPLGLADVCLERSRLPLSQQRELADALPPIGETDAAFLVQLSEDVSNWVA